MRALGRDLTGYEDGSENPKGDAAPAAALVASGAGLGGGSFVCTDRAGDTHSTTSWAAATTRLAMRSASTLAS